MTAKLGLKWDKGHPDRWNYRYDERGGHELIVFELPQLPDFSESRFSILGDKFEERRAALVKKQLEMLRQLHGLGSEGLCLRICRDERRLRLFIIIKVAESGRDLSDFANRASLAFPREYHFSRVTPSNADLWAQATDVSWAQQIVELVKPENVYRSPYPQAYPYYYEVAPWQPSSHNAWENLCRNLLQFRGQAAVDILLVPTRLDEEEREWAANMYKEMREAFNGKKLRGEKQILQEFPPMAELKPAVDNYENLLGRYTPQSFLFLYALRVLASDSPAGLTEAFHSSFTSSKPQIVAFRSGQSAFVNELKSAAAICVNADKRTPFWNSRQEIFPFRAQRLHCLADLDEIASAWRLPIPVGPGFPGFPLDTGLSDGREAIAESAQLISLGHYMEDQGKLQEEACINQEELTKHGLIVGVPGSGKTTMVFSLLHQLWNRPNPAHRVPFIVLEPAKTEYRALKSLEAFRTDLQLYTLGDETVSPFRFNPFAVLDGIPLESHISRLNACFVGAFNLFDPLPLLLDKAIRQTYETNGWYEDSVGGEMGVQTPTLTNLCEQAQLVIRKSGYSDKLRDDFNAALLQRLESLRRGSKGRMLDTRQSLSGDVLMKRPIVLELDALNEDEKALMMMFILSFVYEFARSTRRSGSPLKHVLLIEEAHNLIGVGGQTASEFRANPRDHAIRLFVRMLAEMRALGQSILICDQLPTALAPEAIKQTNLKILMRLTALDDREQMGNTMDLGEAQQQTVVRLKTGQAYAYLQEWDRVRLIQSRSFKKQNSLDVPPDDRQVRAAMKDFELQQPDLYMPFSHCRLGCQVCSRRTRNQAERFVARLTAVGGDIGGGRNSSLDKYAKLLQGTEPLSPCATFQILVGPEMKRLQSTYGSVNPVFPFCAYLHLLNTAPEEDLCRSSELLKQRCDCRENGRTKRLKQLLEMVAAGSPEKQ